MPAALVHSHAGEANHRAHPEHNAERGIVINPLAAFVGGKETSLAEAEHGCKSCGEKTFHVRSTFNLKLVLQQVLL